MKNKSDLLVSLFYFARCKSCSCICPHRGGPAVPPAFAADFHSGEWAGKLRCINFYINKFQIPSPTLRGVAKRPLILADMTFLTRLRSSEIPPLIVLAA